MQLPTDFKISILCFYRTCEYSQSISTSKCCCWFFFLCVSLCSCFSKYVWVQFSKKKYILLFSYDFCRYFYVNFNVVTLLIRLLKVWEELPFLNTYWDMSQSPTTNSSLRCQWISVTMFIEARYVNPLFEDLRFKSMSPVEKLLRSWSSFVIC